MTSTNLLYTVLYTFCNWNGLLNLQAAHIKTCMAIGYFHAHVKPNRVSFFTPRCTALSRLAARPLLFLHWFDGPFPITFRNNSSLRHAAGILIWRPSSWILLIVTVSNLRRSVPMEYNQRTLDHHISPHRLNSARRAIMRLTNKTKFILNDDYWCGGGDSPGLCTCVHSNWIHYS